MQRAIFLDRDGTVNEEVGYINHIERFHIFPWAAPAVRRINDAGWKTILITNQAGAARGYFPLTLIERVHQMLKEHLQREGAYLDGIYFCPHHPAAAVEELRIDCECRKPKPGMLLRAAREHGIDLADSWVIGDRHVETEMAHAVGARSALVMTGYGRGELEYGRQSWTQHPDHTAENLLEAVEWILSHSPNH